MHKDEKPPAPQKEIDERIGKEPKAKNDVKKKRSEIGDTIDTVDGHRLELKGRTKQVCQRLVDSSYAQAVSRLDKSIQIGATPAEQRAAKIEEFNEQRAAAYQKIKEYFEAEDDS